jgi:DNA-binding transcriptional ArsR family regulator
VSVEQGDASHRADSTPSEPERKQDRRRLPPELTGRLPAKFEKGLDHVVRRRILRALHGSSGASPISLTRGELGDETLSGVSYHCRVLLTYEMVELVGTEEARGSIRHTYASVVEENAPVLSVLGQTEELDKPRRRDSDRGRTQ